MRTSDPEFAIDNTDAAREVIAYGEACENGYVGTLEEFRHARKSAVATMADLGDDDLPF